MWSEKMRIMTKSVLLTVPCIWVALWISSSHAQVLTGTIVGQVVDESVTNTAGDYSFPSLPGGVYDVVISKNGFTTFSARGIPVTVGQVARVADAALRVGQITETVSVSAQSAVLQTDR